LGLEGLGQLKNPPTSSEIELANFRLDVMDLDNFTLLIAILGEICFEENLNHSVNVKYHLL
jgi:hypothetical protein